MLERFLIIFFSVETPFQLLIDIKNSPDLFLFFFDFPNFFFNLLPVFGFEAIKQFLDSSDFFLAFFHSIGCLFFDFIFHFLYFLRVNLFQLLFDFHSIIFFLKAKLLFFFSHFISIFSSHFLDFFSVGLKDFFLLYLVFSDCSFLLLYSEGQF